MNISQYIESFLNLSTSFKRIYKYLIGIRRSKRRVFPSLATIAEACGCSIRTVSRAIKTFVEYQLLCYFKRPYQSNTYLIPEEALKIDFAKVYNNDSYIAPENSVQNVQQNVHVLSVANNKRNICGTYKEDRTVYKDFNKKETSEVKPYVDRIPDLNEQDKVLLSKYPEFVVANAYDDAKWYRRCGRKIRNFAAFMTSRCKEHLNFKPPEIGK